MTPERAFNPIRSLESSWRLLNQAPLPLWLGGLILALIEMVGGAEVRVGSSSEGGEVSALWLLLALLGLVLWLVTSLASAYVGAGYFSTVREVLAHREKGIPLKRQAVLFRASHHSIQLELLLA